MKKFSWALSLFGILMFMASCIKSDFDVPPDNKDFDPKLAVTHTIAQVQEMPKGVQITEDIIIQGIVNMDDKEGNYYKKIVIQDETGGIDVLLDMNNLYNEYPVGRKIYIKLKGLYLGDYSGIPQIGYNPNSAGQLSEIPYSLMGNYIVKANYPNPIIPVEVSIADILSPNAMKHLINKLIVIKDAEFSVEALNLPYATPLSNTNRKIQECSSTSKIDLRTSGYAKFQPEIVPGGRGTITAIYTRYNNTPQLAIRSSADVNFDQPRCDGSLPTGPELISIDSLRKKYSGAAVALSGIKIKGVVISDRANGNVNGQNLIIQDGEKGIMVRYSSAHNFNVGDSVVVNVSGASLEEYKQLLQVNGAIVDGTSKFGTGTIAPKVITIGDLLANFETYESTLVKIMNGTISATGTFAGSKTLTDGTGSLTLFTLNAASFASNPLPTEPKNYTGIVGQYDATKQLSLRSATDVE